MLFPALSARRFPSLGALMLLAAAGCSRQPVAQTGDLVTNYEVRGILREASPGSRRARISHEAIPGYMEAMTMEFETAEPAQLAELQPGDALAFRLSVTEKRGWIDRLRKLDARPAVPAAPEIAPTQATLPATLPDCELIDETGRAFHLSDYAGHPLAITFIFTRCPYPDFCPRMNERFAELQRVITHGHFDMHLLSITLDPEYDTPERLAEYAKRYVRDPKDWKFATGARADIRALGAAVGLRVNETPSLPEHNLRTVVVDAGGRVRRIFSGNTWTASELAAEMERAPLAKP